MKGTPDSEGITVRYKVLIVDDHPLFRAGLSSVLPMFLPQTHVLGAGSAEEGLAVLGADPEVDLVLIDIHLPGMDGFEALAVYGERFPTVSRMLISGQEGPAAARRALAAGASGFLPKSLPLEEVAEAIRRVLGGEIFVPPEGDDPSGEASGAAPALTLRRLEVLELLGEGYSNREIARALAISERTVKAHLTAIFQILDADNRTEAVVRAQALGYLKPK